jgi:hypothetical protein
VLIAGCTSTPEPEESPAPEQAPATAEPQEPSEVASSPRPEASSAPTEAIATALGEFEGLRLEILALRRSGETLTLDFAIVNETDEDISVDTTVALASPEGGSSNAGTVSGVTLVDDVNLQRYLVLREPDTSACVCSDGISTIYAAGSRTIYFATFPAPGEDVAELTVQVPRFSPVNAVPLT